MPKSVLEWAIEAYVHSVEALEPLGSDNKRFRVAGNIPHAEYERQILRDNAIKTNLKPTQPTGARATMDNVVAYGLKAERERAGNCFEHAAVAASYLHAQGGAGPVFDVVQIPTLDHAFVVLGQARPASGIYPMLFRQWDPGAVICDGWARICCPARDYAVIWDRTMGIWHAGGLEVPARQSGWGSAADYRGETEKYPKQSYITAPSSSCLIATAACRVLGMDEHCPELTALRRFRDTVLLREGQGAQDVARYYAMAPRVLARIGDCPVTLRDIHARHVAPATQALARGEHDRARAIFLALLHEMTALTLPDEPSADPPLAKQRHG